MNKTTKVLLAAVVVGLIVGAFANAVAGPPNGSWLFGELVCVSFTLCLVLCVAIVEWATN
jgi:hypothetical protein